MNRLAAAACLLLALVAAAFGDTVVLRNGRKVKGKIVRQDKRTVVVHVDGLGNLTLERSSIKSIVVSDEAPAPPSSDPARPGATKGARRSRWESAEDALAAGFSVEVRAGSLGDALEQLGKDVGIEIALLPGATRYVETTRPVIQGLSGRRTLGETLSALVEKPTHRRLMFRAEGKRVLVGRPYEIWGAKGTPHGIGVRWTDAEGDATMFSSVGAKAPDLTMLYVGQGRDGLEIVLTFNYKVNGSLNSKDANGEMHGYDLAEIYLDLDNDEKTGHPVGRDGDRPGFDARIRISTGFDFRDAKGNSLSQWGNITSVRGEHRVDKPYVIHHVYDIAKYIDYVPPGGGGVVRPDSERRALTQVRGREIRIRVPREDLGLTKAARIRACFIDELQVLGTNGRLSQDGFFDLR
jgi:hypothetical protein